MIIIKLTRFKKRRQNKKKVEKVEKEKAKIN